MFRKSNSGNKGFSLVELLIAVTILGLSAGMVLHSFVTASNITKQNKIYGEATAAADNIAEAVYAYSADIDDDNPGPKTLSSSAFDMLGINTDDLFKLDQTSDEADKGISSVALENVESGDSVFDAKITWSPGDPDADTTSDEYGVYELNNYDMAQYTEMDGSFTQPYKTSENPDVLADEEFYDEVSATAYTISDGKPVYKAKTRLISVNIYQKTYTGSANDAHNGETATYMDVIFNYTYTYDAYEIVDNIKVGKASEPAVYVTAPDSFVYHVAFAEKNDAGETTGTRREYFGTDEPTVFLMYYPDYNAKKYGAYKRYSNYDTGDDNVPDDYMNLIKNNNLYYRDYNTSGGVFKGRDVIVINNLENIDTKFFVIKQRQVYTDSDALTYTGAVAGEPVSDAYLTAKGLENASYRASVVQRFTDSTRANDNTKNKLYTNAGINMVTNAKIGGFAAYKVVGAWGSVVTYSGTELDESNDLNKFVSRKFVTTAKDGRYYMVTVEIYKQGSLNPASARTVTDDDGNVTDIYYSVDADASAIYTFDGNKLT